MDSGREAVDVIAPGRHRPQPGVVVHRGGDFDRVRRDGLPVVPVARALRESATRITFSRLRRALAEAEYLRILDPRAIEAEMGRGRAGSPALRRAWAQHQPRLARTRSALEERFLALCEEERIPLPEVNVMVGRHTVDAVWRSKRVAVELDSRLAHETPAMVQRDLDRDLDLRSSGYTVIRYAWRQITGEPAAVAADLRRVLSNMGEERFELSQA